MIKAQPLLQFAVTTNAVGSVELEFKVDVSGLRLVEGVARPRVASRVVAVMGRRGAGKSFLCRKLVEGSVLAATKAQVCVCVVVCRRVCGWVDGCVYGEVVEYACLLVCALCGSAYVLAKLAVNKSLVYDKFTSMRMYVCLYVYIYMCVCAIGKALHTPARIHTARGRLTGRARIYIHTQMYIHTRKHICIHTHIHTYILTYIHTARAQDTGRARGSAFHSQHTTSQGYLCICYTRQNFHISKFTHAAGAGDTDRARIHTCIKRTYI